MVNASSPDADIVVIIINWNSGGMLLRAVDALSRQNCPHRILVIDNASSDNSIDRLEAAFPGVEVIQASSNLGFAAGNNLALRHVGLADWVALLNPDAFPEPDWLGQLMSAANTRPHFACFASRVVFDAEPAKLDGAGDEYHLSGFAWRRAHGRSITEVYGDGEVFMPSATAALYRRNVLDEVGGFDEMYFCYYEDVDLGFRLRLRGHRTWYVHNAVVRHVGSGITGRRSAFVTYHTQRNRIWTYAKDMPTPWVWFFLPLHLLYQIVAVVRYATQGQFGPAVSGALDALRGLPRILEERKAVQRSRRASWREVVETMRWGLLDPILRR